MVTPVSPQRKQGVPGKNFRLSSCVHYQLQHTPFPHASFYTIFVRSAIGLTLRAASPM